MFHFIFTQSGASAPHNNEKLWWIITEDKKCALLNAVKIAVARYGISGVSTRNIAEIAGVSDSHIYRCFKDKEEMLLQAYMRENGAIFSVILREIDKSHNLPISFKEKARLSFDKTWRVLLSDADRLTFCVSYYHSNFFSVADEYHTGQLEELTNRLSDHFATEADCKHAMYSMCSVLYDSAYAIINGHAEDTDEYANRVFETEQAIFISQSKLKEDK